MLIHCSWKLEHGEGGDILDTSNFLNLPGLDNICKKNHGERLLIQEACKGGLFVSVTKLLSERRFQEEDNPMFWALHDITGSHALWNVCQSTCEGHKTGFKSWDAGSQCLRNTGFCKFYHCFEIFLWSSVTWSYWEKWSEKWEHLCSVLPAGEVVLVKWNR